jgi:hypothetical protein
MALNFCIALQFMPGARLTDHQHRQIALGKAANRRHSEIAKASNVSVSSVAHLANAPDIKSLIAQLQASTPISSNRCTQT